MLVRVAEPDSVAQPSAGPPSPVAPARLVTLVECWGHDVGRRAKLIGRRGPRGRNGCVGTAFGAVLLAACTSGARDVSSPSTVIPFDWPPRSVSTVPSATLSGTIVEIWVVPYPEGSNFVTYRDPDPAHAGANIANGKIVAFLKVVGWPLPEPLDQPVACRQGIPNYTDIDVFDTGVRQS